MMNSSIRATAIRPAAWWQFIHCQWLNLVRMPAYSLPTLLFPVMFYAFFGLVMIRGQAHYLLATFATFGIMGAALFSFGVSIATERAQGWFTLLRATPAPLAGVVAGKWFGAAIFAAVIVVMMEVLAAVFGGVRMHPGQWFGLVGVLVVGTLPFCLLGLGLGLLMSPNAAPAVINIVYLPLAFLSGLWVPVSQFPAWLQGFAGWLPPYHLAQLALHAAGVKPTEIMIHVLALAGFSAAFLLLVAVGWRRTLQSP